MDSTEAVNEGIFNFVSNYEIGFRQLAQMAGVNIEISKRPNQ